MVYLYICHPSQATHSFINFSPYKIPDGSLAPIVKISWNTISRVTWIPCDTSPGRFRITWYIPVTVTVTCMFIFYFCLLRPEEGYWISYNLTRSRPETEKQSVCIPLNTLHYCTNNTAIFLLIRLSCNYESYLHLSTNEVRRTRNFEWQIRGTFITWE